MRFQLCKSGSPSLPKEGWIFERKYDGARVFSIDGKLWNRSHSPSSRAEGEIGRDITEHFPEIRPPQGWVLDGEIVSPDGDLGKVVGRELTTDPFKWELRSKLQPCVYKVFDVLRTPAGEVSSLPLIERKKILQSLPPSPGVEIAEWTEDGEGLWERARREGWEGIIAKHKFSPYIGGRTGAWLKIKNWKEIVLPILRWERTEKGGFVIYVPTPSGGEERVVVNGYDDQWRIQNSTTPLQAEIQYLEITKGGRFRKPSLKRVFLEEK